jgi:hypothetical protein
LIEEAFDLPPLGPADKGYTDTRGAKMDDVFDFSQKPRTFTPIHSIYPEQYFVKASPSNRAPDDD